MEAEVTVAMKITAPLSAWKKILEDLQRADEYHDLDPETYNLMKMIEGEI